MPIEQPGFGTSFVQGFGETAIPSLQKALAQYLEEQRQRKAFDEFMAQTTTTKTVPAPTAPAIPPPLGSLLQNAPVRGVETQVQEPMSITDPKFLAAAQQYGIASPEGLKQFLGLRQMTMPQYPQAEIAAGGTRITYKTDPNGGPPIPVREDLGQPRVTPADRYYIPRMENGKPVTAQFGNMIRTIEDEYDRTTGQKTGAWKYGEGGAQPSAAGADSRVDKSYQFHTSQITALGKPIQDRMSRLENIQTSLDQNSPQADALIAPELLTAMAGGQGSGLRMNEAEIARIVGGRNHWQDLKSAALKWQLDPSKPFQITDEQRKQVRSLVDATHALAENRMNAITDAQQRLAVSTDPMEHRKIFSELRNALSGTAKAQKLSAEDQQAVEWARKNPNDPRSAKILQLNGLK